MGRAGDDSGSGDTAYYAPWDVDPVEGLRLTTPRRCKAHAGGIQGARLPRRIPREQRLPRATVLGVCICPHGDGALKGHAVIGEPAKLTSVVAYLTRRARCTPGALNPLAVQSFSDMPSASTNCYRIRCVVVVVRRDGHPTHAAPCSARRSASKRIAPRSLEYWGLIGVGAGPVTSYSKVLYTRSVRGHGRTFE